MLKAQQIRDDVKELQDIDIKEHLGDSIPMDIEFTNSEGQRVKIKQYFDRQKPVVLVLAYYTCPMLCTLVLNGVAQVSSKAEIDFGKQYRIVTVSIDPTETPELAASKKEAYLNMIQRSKTDSSWAFLTGKEEQIKRLADAIGFKYHYVEDREEYAHPAVITLLTGNGKISRYLYGIEYNPRDYKLGLLEASEGKVGSSLDKLLLYCYHYDPNSEGYVVFAGNVMKLGGVVTLIALGLFLLILWFKDVARKRLA